MLIAVVLALMGLCFGSFVNALVWRLHMQQRLGKKSNRSGNNSSWLPTLAKIIPRYDGRNRYSILLGRSMCPSCHHQLAPTDLIPVVSWVLLHGKCRYCSKPISWQYPVVELLVALIFVLSYVWWPLGFSTAGSFSFGLWLIFLTAFVALGIYDLRWFILPDRIVYPLIGLALLEMVIRATVFGGGWRLVIAAFWGVFFLAGLFYSFYVISKGTWIGFGDVKLAVVLGLLVGGPLMALLLIFLASVFGSILAIPLLIKGQARATTQIPFGPFLLVATILVVIFGNHISGWYNSFLYFH